MIELIVVLAGLACLDPETAKRVGKRVGKVMAKATREALDAIDPPEDKEGDK